MNVVDHGARATSGRVQAVVPGHAHGPVLSSSVPLSFMGGVDPATGVVLDVHHPLCGQSVAGAVLVLPSGRGSCAGSGVLLELLVGRSAPAALVFDRPEPILTFGVLLGSELFGLSIPVLQVDEITHAALAASAEAVIDQDRLTATGGRAVADGEGRAVALPVVSSTDTHLVLTKDDEDVLHGGQGRAAQVAMRLVLHAARLEGASGLLDVTRAHIDGCFYQGPASLRLAERLHELGATVRVPSTMNALCIDRRRWRDQGVAEDVGLPSERIADLHVAMGVAPTYTCAPYLLQSPPAPGERIAWGESNAVVFANSVLGAHTLKYPDYLDLLVAIVGRAPDTGAYTEEGRRPTLRVHVGLPTDDLDDSFWPVLGYHLGSRFPNDVPLITGLEDSRADHDDLRAFGAAYATTSASALFHIAGVTQEARTGRVPVPADPAAEHEVTADDLLATWHELNPTPHGTVDLVAVGNPHFSLSEYQRLAVLCRGRTRHDATRLVVTANRHVHEQAQRLGLVDRLQGFGVEFIADTCWCLIDEPVIGAEVASIITSSGKYAHYGPAATGRAYHLRGLAACVDAAATGKVPAPPGWLECGEPPRHAVGLDQPTG